MTSASEDRWRDLRPDPENDTPLYLQLARKLGTAIHENRWNAGEALPSERVLSEALGVSRITSRKAIALLVEQGLIRRTQGAGSAQQGLATELGVGGDVRCVGGNVRGVLSYIVIRSGRAHV